MSVNNETKQVSISEPTSVIPREATGIILAGGKNSRMGQNKAFLSVKKEQKMIEFTVELFNSIFQEVIIVSNEPELYHYLGVEVISDIIPQRGPLSGIHAGLTKAKHKYSFIVPCDMPFLEHGLIRLLLDEAPGYDVVVPQIENYLEPLHAVYNKSCLGQIEKCLAENIRKVYAFYPWVKVNFVGENKLNKVAVNNLDKVFLNVNTQAELDLAKQIEGK